MPWVIRMRETDGNGIVDQQIGDCFKQVHQMMDGTTKECWYVVLPNGTMWNVYGPSSDGTPWDVTGELPNITVKPSIFPQPIIKKDGTVHRQGWHGYIANGVISDDLEGRRYD